MTEEFYHKDIFGTVVNACFGQTEEEDKLPMSEKSAELFNLFTLTDAFGARQKRVAWVLYQKALSVGVPPEVVFFKIVWQIKSMLIASKTKNAGEVDMKTFPYNKAKGFLKNFKPGELEKISEGLVIDYGRIRKGETEMKILVEKLLLSL
jgi:hypothetical protein